MDLNIVVTTLEGYFRQVVEYLTTTMQLSPAHIVGAFILGLAMGIVITQRGK